jgi:homospermidine synthase
LKLSASGRLILLGCGAVSRCLQALLLQNDEVKYSRVVLVDACPQDPKRNPLIEAGAVFHHFRLTPENYEKFLFSTVKSGDVVVNLLSGVDSADILEWCHNHNVIYVDTSVELWRKESNELSDPLLDTMFMRYTRLYDRFAHWRDGAPTAVLEHGANPGLVSHWLKHGLEYLASELPDTDIEMAVRAKDYARVAMLTGTKVVHVSEYDRQISSTKRNPTVFVNTWSAEGLREESNAFTECSWGSHERSLPPESLQLSHDKLFHLCIKRKGINFPVRSWVPHEEMTGMMIPHGETFTIGNRLSLWENGKLIYRPTVCFIYRPSLAALQSLYAFADNEINVDRDHLLTTEISEGSDDLGVLLMGTYGAVWVGNRLTIKRSREVVGPHYNATVLQVASSVLSAMTWAMENPRRGLLLPGDLPFQSILPVAHKYIGDLEIHRTNWRPLSNHGRNFDWQFQDFSMVDNGKTSELLLPI